WPASARKRSLTSSRSTALRASAKRSCTAVATLFTFCPPGPAERMKATCNSASGISRPGLTNNPMRLNLAALAREVGLLLNQAYVVLLHRDRDAVFLEQTPDLAVHIRSHIVDAVHRIADPEAHFDAH